MNELLAQFAQALADDPRALSKIARAADMSYPTVFALAKGKGKPNLSTITRLAHVLGYRIRLTPGLAPSTDSE